MKKPEKEFNDLKKKIKTTIEYLEKSKVPDKKSIIFLLKEIIETYPDSSAKKELKSHRISNATGNTIINLDAVDSLRLKNIVFESSIAANSIANLDGKIIDLNLIVRRDHVQVRYEIIKLSEDPFSFVKQGGVAFIFGLAGEQNISIGEISYILKERDTLQMDDPQVQVISISGSGAFVLMELK